MIKVNQGNIKDVVLDGVVIKKIQGIRESDDKLPNGEFENPKVVMTVSYDLTGIELEKVLDKALQTYVIKFANRARKLGTKWTKAHKEYSVKVAEFFVGRVPAKGKAETVSDWFGSLDEEQRAEFLANPEQYLEKFAKQDKGN